MALFKPSTWFARKRHTGVGIDRVQRRSFAAAEIKNTLAPWTWDGGFSNEEVRAALRLSRERSRDMYKNSPLYKRYVSLFAANVVGDGFTFKSTPHDGAPGFTNYRLDKTAAKFIETHFWLWCNNPAYCDVTGRKTVAEIDRLNCKTWARDGEYFILIDRHAQNPYGISLRVIRPDAVDDRYNGFAADGNYIRMGVELDKTSMKPVAYYLFTTQEYATTIGGYGPLIRIPAEDMIHGYIQEDEDQTRGITLGHAGLKKLKMLDAFDEAEMVAALDEANTIGVWTAPVGREGEVANLQDPANKTALDAMTTPSENGMKIVAPQGFEYKTFTPQHPNREITPFKSSMQRDFCGSVGIEYSNATNDWAGVNYGSVRAGVLSERDQWTIYQQMYIDQCKSPVFRAWLKSFLSLEISGGFPIEKFGKFSEHEYRGRRWLWVDPLKDVKGAELARKYGWKTDQQITSDFGGDFGDNVEEIKRADDMVKGTSLEVKDEKATTTV